MKKDRLAENIAYYRKQRGLSQEKLSEYMGVSRQAVTKWENAVSRPCSDNLIRLAQLFEIDVATLSGSKEETTERKAPPSAGKMPWIFIGISFLCMVVYVAGSIFLDIFSVGTLICMFVLCVPIQLFLHVYLANAIQNDSFSGIAGFDEKIDYDLHEVKKLLIQINLHIGIKSTVYVFLLCAVNCADLKMGWINSFLILLYVLDFIMSIEIDNYKMIDRIYLSEDDKKRAKHAIRTTVLCIVTASAVIGMILFAVRTSLKGV